MKAKLAELVVKITNILILNKVQKKSLLQLKLLRLRIFMFIPYLHCSPPHQLIENFIL